MLNVSEGTNEGKEIHILKGTTTTLLRQHNINHERGKPTITKSFDFKINLYRPEATIQLELLAEPPVKKVSNVSNTWPDR